MGLLERRFSVEAFERGSMQILERGFFNRNISKGLQWKF